MPSHNKEAKVIHAMALVAYHTVKKAYFYNFYPTKAEEEAGTARPTSFGSRPQRLLVEMRDVLPPPVLDPHNPWQIKKTLSHFEIASGKIIVSFHDAFEYILRYWNFCMANHIAVMGNRVAVVIWDVTSESKPRKYEGNHVYFQITPTDNCVLTCTEMMRNRNLKVGNFIGLYWDTRESNFRFRLFYTRA